MCVKGGAAGTNALLGRGELSLCMIDMCIKCGETDLGHILLPLWVGRWGWGRSCDVALCRQPSARLHMSSTPLKQKKENICQHEKGPRTKSSAAERDTFYSYQLHCNLGRNARNF
jgi:hypothetical protein